MNNTFYNAQGYLIEPFTSSTLPNVQEEWVYKLKCKPNDCPDCPKGSYCYTCKNCKLHNFKFEESKTDTPPIQMMECQCKKHKYDRAPTYTVINIGETRCPGDIANCDGKLKCGRCFNTSFYSFKGELLN